MNNPDLNLPRSSFESEKNIETLGSLYDELYNTDSQLSFGETRIIRENPWPLILSNNGLLDNNLIVDLEKRYGIPRIILVELFGILQSTGFLKGGSITLGQDAESKFTNVSEAKEEIINGITKYNLGNGLTRDDFIESINTFLSKLSQLKIIKEIILQKVRPEEIPNGLFRITSLYDINFSNFDSLDDLLDFLFINVKVQDKLFGDKYLDLLKETSGIPVDGIPGRETTRFSQDKFVVKVGEIDLGHKEAKQNVDVNFRIFPFSPTGLGFAVSLDLEDIGGQESNSNYLALYLLHFEKRGMSVVPVINTIQNSFRNIGIDNNGKLYHVNEPLNEQERAKGITLLEESDGDLKVKKAKKQEILESIEKNILSGLHMDTEIIAIISDNLFHSGFSSVEGINGRDNLWLAKHSGRTPKGIENTVDGLYRKVFKTLGGKETECGNMEIDFLGVFKYLSRYPKGLDVLERISGLVGSLTGEVNKLLANPTSEKNMQNAENFNSKILENLGYLNTRGTKLENFVDLYASMTGKLVMDLLDTSDGRRKLIIGTEESRRHLRDKRVTEHENRVEIALSAQLNSLYSVSMRVEEIINSGGNVGYLPNIKDIIDNILSIKFY